MSVLQTKIADLQKRIEALVLPSEVVPESPKEPPLSVARPVRSILWVDDNPKNNSYITYITATLTDLCG